MQYTAVDRFTGTLV